MELVEAIKYSDLRSLVLEYFLQNPRTQIANVLSGVKDKAFAKKLLPTKEYCEKNNIDYSRYPAGQLNFIDEMNINQIVGDLIVERIVTEGSNNPTEGWPWVRLTSYGKEVVKKSVIYYDQDRYIAQLTSLVPKTDSIILQYIAEGMSCYRQNLVFAAAVMFGAASERLVLNLLDSIKTAETNKTNKDQITKLLQRPELPSIFKIIETTIQKAISSKKIPYSVHQGCTEHLLSLFEMIRVHRNDSVHPKVSQVNREKVFLTVTSFPGACECVYKLIEWFSKNKI